MNRGGKIAVIVFSVFAVLVILSLYFVFAASPVLSKSYDSSSQTVTIKNSNAEIAAIKLDTPVVYDVIRGKDRLVAEFTINNLANSNNVFSNIEFYDLKDNNRKISRQVTYRYKAFENIEVPDYTMICSSSANANGSVTNSCVKKQTGTHTEQKTIWKDLDEKTTLPKGTIIIGIFADVYPNERIEWVPTLYGVKVNEWAQWTEGLNKGLIHAWKFDESYGNNAKDSITNNQYNGTLNGAYFVYEGKEGNSVNFSSEGDAVDLNEYISEPAFASDYSIAFWVKLSEPTPTGGHVLDDVNTGEMVQLGFGSSTIFFNFGGREIPEKPIDYNLGKWTFYVVERNFTTVYFYENGSLIGTGTNGEDGSVINGLKIGCGKYGFACITGGLDELYIWNRTLNNGEIQDLWNGGAGVFYTESSSDTDNVAPETTEPIITPSNPELNKPLYCNATITDNDEINLGALWKWYRDDYVFSFGYTAVQNGTNSLITSLDGSNMSGGDIWRCEVTPSDSFLYGEAKNSSAVQVITSIIFNVTDSYSGLEMNNVTIDCNSSNFSQGGIINPYGPYEFVAGNYECTFSKEHYFDKKMNFTADGDRIVSVLMSEDLEMTVEEHSWLEWLYNCWSNGTCMALLENANKSAAQTWQKMIETNRAVVNQEDILSDTLTSEQNISINYTINIPYKDSIPLNDLVPLRIYFWFTDTGKTICYNQDKTDANRAESPYCLPLVAEILGPNGGTVNFQVDLRPNLEAGTYGIVRSIEVDPSGIWTQYGREEIGTINVANDNNKADISFIEKAKTLAEKTGITGAVLGAVNSLLSGWQIVAIIATIGFVIVVFIISKTIIRLRK